MPAGLRLVGSPAEGAERGLELYRARLMAELARDLDGIAYLQGLDPPQITEEQAADWERRIRAAHESLLLQAELPCFRVWREDIRGRVRYIARAQHPGAHPHTLVTADIGELRALLIGGPW